MGNELQPVLLEDLEISLPGFALRRLALNQHMPKVERLDEHRHGYHQCLLYLRGSGRQRLEGREVAVRRGTLLVIAPGVPHRFVKEGELRPLCLAIDFEADEAGAAAETWAELSHLPAPVLARVEETLVALHHAEASPLRSVLRIGALLLDLMALLEERATARERAAPVEPRGAGPVSAAVQRFVARHGLAGLSPGGVARHLGRSLDHLNRQLRRECGLTVGEALAQARLARARELLADPSLGVAAVAAAVGMEDQNYFARWFRKQTGESPSRWRAGV